MTTEQGILRTSQSRLDDGRKQAGNLSPLEIAIVHNPDIDDIDLASLIHNLRDRWPYLADYTSLPFPFASSAKQYAVGVKDRVELDTEVESEDVVQLSLF